MISQVGLIGIFQKRGTGKRATRDPLLQRGIKSDVIVNIKSGNPGPRDRNFVDAKHSIYMYLNIDTDWRGMCRDAM